MQYKYENPSCNGYSYKLSKPEPWEPSRTSRMKSTMVFSATPYLDFIHNSLPRRTSDPDCAKTCAQHTLPHTATITTTQACHNIKGQGVSTEIVQATLLGTEVGLADNAGNFQDKLGHTVGRNDSLYHCHPCLEDTTLRNTRTTLMHLPSLVHPITRHVPEVTCVSPSRVPSR